MHKSVHMILCDLLHVSSYAIVLNNWKAALRLKKIPNNFIILS